MATAALQIPFSNHVVPGSHLLKGASYPKSIGTLPTDVEKVAADWIFSFNAFVQGEDPPLSQLFLNESYWRDLLCLTWDFHTLGGPEKIASFIKKQKKGCRIRSLKLDTSSDVRKSRVSAIDFGGDLKGVQSFLSVQTDVGWGRGLVRLLRDPEDEGNWKCFTLFTALEELTGYEELVSGRRPTGVDHGSQPGRKNWKDRRVDEENAEGEMEPTVLIVGKSPLL